MSDIDTTTTDAPAADPTPAAPATTEDHFANPLADDQPLVSRGFAENLRAEGLKYRTDLRDAQARMQTYEDVFGGYEQADRDVWFDLARTWQTNPAQAAAAMQAIANAVMGDEGGPPPEEPPPTTPPETPPPAATPLTEEGVAKMIADALAGRDQQANEDRMVETVLAEVRAEGFDPDGMDGFMVLWAASNKTNGDVKAAAQQLRDYQQSIIDNYVQGRANGQHPMPSPNGTAGTEVPVIGSWDDVRRGAAKFMEAASGNGLP